MITRPNILVYHPNKANAFAKWIREAGFTSVKAAESPQEAEKYLPNTEIILGWKFPADLLNKPIALSVRWFQSIGAGVDDLTSEPSILKGITLTRIVDQFGANISEYVFTFLLYIVKDVPRMRTAQIERQWDPFISKTLAGKTMGVAGLGSIGAEIVRKARAFDMKVHGLSFSGKHASLVDSHFTTEEWRKFVKELDYLVLTLPLTEKTHHLINKEILAEMKENACLVNVGRGALIDEADLLTFMKSGRLQAAILDVFEKEPLPKDHPFYVMPNVYLTSHLSGPSTVEDVSRFFIENLKRYLNNQPLQGLVNLINGY